MAADRLPDPDRTVHATNYDVEIVRYDKRGHWYAEGEDGRFRISLAEAVTAALAPGANVYLDLPGGRSFDAKVRKRRGF